MKTISVSNRDIQLNGGKIQFATGNAKLVQDLQRWLEEPIGTGWTSPGFGSLLNSYIGQTQNVVGTGTVENEVFRVLQLYQGQQILSLKNAQTSATLGNWNKSELIQSIISIKTDVQATSIICNIALTTLDNSTINLTLSINNNGVSVQHG